MKGKRTAYLLHVATLSTAGAAVMLVAGCTAPPQDSGAPGYTISKSKADKYEAESKAVPNADAGVTLPPISGVDKSKFDKLVSSRSFSPRSNPFDLLAVEKSYDASANADRIVQLYGGYITDWEPPKEPEPEVIEEQPYRRLAGVMVGDSVTALIDMGDGKGLQIIYPGEQIPGTEWTVVSIDQDKAVLERPGNKKPKQIIVSLAASLGGITLPTGSTGGTGPGAGGTGRGAGNAGGQGPRAGGAAGGGGGGSVGGSG